MRQSKQTKRPKRLKRRIVILASIVIVALIVTAVGIFIKMGGEQRQMNAMQTGEFLPGIYAINCDFVNMFIIDCSGTYVAIDAGGNRGAVERGLAQLGIAGDDVAYVLMTHTHGDHTAALGLFGKAVVYGMDGRVASQAVSDGETFAINGKSFQVIGTPGHADDSVCYLMDGGYLFAGDNLSLANSNVGMFNSFYNKSDEQQKADIARLSGYSDVRYVITAHYGFAEKPVFPD